MFVIGKLFKARLIVSLTHMLGHLLVLITVRVGSTLTFKFQNTPKKLSSYEHSSLLRRSVTDEAKKFDDVDTG